MRGVIAGAGARGGRVGLVEGLGTSVEGWAGSGMHGAHHTGLGDVELGQGACQKGGVCPGGAGKVMGRGLGAWCVVGMWDVLGASARMWDRSRACHLALGDVELVGGMSESSGVHAKRAGHAKTHWRAQGHVDARWQG